MFTDKVLTCKECGREFEFTAAEQEFYAEKGFTNEPGRCPECRRMHKQRRNNFSGNSKNFGERAMHKAVCASCGQQTTVPFEPTSDRPVYCRDCFQARRSNRNYR